MPLLVTSKTLERNKRDENKPEMAYSSDAFIRHQRERKTSGIL